MPPFPTPCLSPGFGYLAAPPHGVVDEDAWWQMPVKTSPTSKLLVVTANKDFTDKMGLFAFIVNGFGGTRVGLEKVCIDVKNTSTQTIFFGHVQSCTRLHNPLILSTCQMAGRSKTLCFFGVHWQFLIMAPAQMPG